MDFMDIDQVVEVPDTPDRLAAHNSDSNNIGKGSDASRNYHVTDKDHINGRLRNEPREKGKSVTIDGSKRLFMRPKTCGDSPISLLGNSCSPKNVLPTVDTARNEKGKALCNPNVVRSIYKDGNGFVDLPEKNGRVHVHGKGTSAGASGTGCTHASRKGLFSASDFSAVDAFDASGKSSKSNNNLKIGLSSDRGKGVAVGAQHKTENNVPAFLRPSTSPRVIGQKRLVRNGCISPNNIAKSEQVAEKHDSRRVAKEVRGESGNMASDGPSGTVEIRDLISEAKDSRRCKGKGVSHHSSSEEPDARSKHLSQRSSVIRKEVTDGNKDLSIDVSRFFKESDGWRSTRNPTRKVDLPSVVEDSHVSRGKVASVSAIDQQKNEVQRDHRKSVSSNLNNHFGDLEIASSQQRVSDPSQGGTHAHSLGHFKERSQLTKRQKQGASSSSNGERAMSHTNDTEITSVSTSRERSPSRSTRNKNRFVVGTLDPVIALDESSPEVGNHGSNTRRVRNEDSSAMSLQVEADEMLARELQEQLYNEELAPAFGNDEMDSHHALAMALQQDTSSHAIPGRGPRAYRPTSSGSSASNLFQRSRANPPRGPSIHRGVHAQASTSTRFPRWRGRFPGRARTLLSRTTPRSSMFPPNMDVDTRMQILEALEAVGDMELPTDLLQMGREFNENDYEMLLALDENNHQHGGATRTQINNLPQSTVQADNLQECSICLETPTIGETIRHLPCLHRFHKDCIDEWLRRKTSCPICKSSIT